MLLPHSDRHWAPPVSYRFSFPLNIPRENVSVPIKMRCTQMASDFRNRPSHHQPQRDQLRIFLRAILHRPRRSSASRRTILGVWRSMNQVSVCMRWLIVMDDGIKKGDSLPWWNIADSAAPARRLYFTSWGIAQPLVKESFSLYTYRATHFSLLKKKRREEKKSRKAIT